MRDIEGFFNENEKSSENHPDSKNMAARQLEHSNSVDQTAEQEELRSSLIAHIHATESALIHNNILLDTIILRKLPYTKAQYMVKVGRWETEVLQAQIEMLTEKGKYTLAQKDIEAGIPINVSAYSDFLEDELHSWWHRYDLAEKMYVASVGKLQKYAPLPPQESEKLDSLHSTIYRRLHPQLNPHDKYAKDTFEQARQAYRRGSLAFLESVERATVKYEYRVRQNELENLSVDELYAHLELQQAQVQSVGKRLDAIMHTEPYSLRNKLNDREWLLEQIKSLQEEAKSYREAALVYKKRFAKLASKQRG